MGAVLDAASQLFDRGSATTTAIARRAGVSIGSLYEYFRDRDAILDSLIDRHVREGEATLVAALDAVDPGATTLEADVRRLVDALLALHADYRGLHRRLVLLGLTQPAVRRRIHEAESRLRARIEPWLRSHPRVTVDDPALAARLVTQATNALVHRHVEDSESLPDETLAEELTRVWLAYLTTPTRR